MTVRVVVRPREETDTAALLEVLGRVQPVDRYPILAHHVEPGWMLAASDRAWVATTDGVPVGNIALDLAPDGGRSVTRFFVDPSARGSGAGGALLETVERYADAAGLSLVLEVAAHNEAARRLYAARGWHGAGSHDAWWFGPDAPPQQAYRFVRPSADAHRTFGVTRSPHGEPPVTPT